MPFNINTIFHNVKNDGECKFCNIFVETAKVPYIVFPSKIESVLYHLDCYEKNLKIKYK